MKVTVSVGQMRVAQAEVEANLAKAGQLMAEAARRGSRLLCLPEMWTTGFHWERNRELAAGQATALQRVGEMAKRHGLWVNGSMLLLDEKGRPANTSVLIDDQGRCVATYRKVHLFGMFQEGRHLAAGDELVSAQTPWGKVGLAVCYDLRFPEMFRAYAVRGVGMQLLPAAWPGTRVEHWRVLLRARAIEDQMFVVATNQVGEERFADGSAATYGGASMIVDPWGEVLAEGSEGEEQMITATLETEDVERVRAKMSVLGDRRVEVYEGEAEDGG